MQLIALLVKYGLWQGEIAQPVENAAEYAVRREQFLKLNMNLWDWLRVLIAVKFAESSLDVVFFSIPRYRFLLTEVRVIPWATAVLGILGAGFYGYRLFMVNRKLKEMGGGRRVSPQIDRSHLHGGILYYNPADPSWFVGKYLINFANKWVYVFLVCLLCLPLLMFWPMLNS